MRAVRIPPCSFPHSDLEDQHGEKHGRSCVVGANKGTRFAESRLTDVFVSVHQRPCWPLIIKHQVFAVVKVNIGELGNNSGATLEDLVGL